MGLGVAGDQRPGIVDFVTLPGGATTRIGRKAPEFLGIDGSVMWSMPL